MYTAIIADNMHSTVSTLDSTSLDGAVRQICAAVGVDHAAVYTVCVSGLWATPEASPTGPVSWDVVLDSSRRYPNHQLPGVVLGRIDFSP